MKRHKHYKRGFEINETLTNFLTIEDNEEEEEVVKPTASGEFLEWLDILCIAIIAVVIIFSFIFRVATIDGPSMRNTLQHGDKVIITNFNYEPKQGDIVVVSRNKLNTVEGQKKGEEPIIKRVIAVGGQTVDIDFDTGTVYVDGKALEENYIGSPTQNKGDVEFPLYVPEGHVFILGDNRADSLDSRFKKIGNDGLVDNRYVLGHAVFRFFPIYKIGVLD